MSSVPITSHDHGESSPGAQRRAPRQKIGPLVYVDLGPSNGGFPINVSVDGLAFQGVRPVHTDELFPIKFKLPDLDNAVETSGQVIWVNQIGTGGGLRFVNLPEDYRLLIKNWISSENQPTVLIGSGGQTVVANLREAKPENTIAAPGALHSTDHVVQTSASFSAMHMDATPSARATPHPLNPATPAPPLKIHVAPVTNGEKRAWFARPGFLAISGIVMIAGVGLVSMKFGLGGTLEKKLKGNISELFSGSTPITASPAALEPEAGSQIGGQSGADRSSSELEVNPERSAALTVTLDAPASEKRASQPQASAAASRAKLGTPQKAAKHSIAFSKTFTKALTLRPIIKAETEVTSPAIVLPAKPQLAPLLTMELPEPPAPITSRLFRQTTRVEPARLLVRRNPVYPELARTSRTSGSVDLQFTIGADGGVHDIKVVRGNTVLVNAAVDAVKLWRFQPARRDGISIESESTAVVTFKLD